MHDKLIKYSDKLIKLSVFAALFIVPLAFWLPAYESFELPKSTAFYCFTGFALAMLILKHSTTKSSMVIWTSFSFPLALLAAAFTLSFFKGVSINPYAAGLHWQFLKMLGACAALYFISINTFGRADIKRFIFFIMLPYFIVAIYGVMQYFGMDAIKWVSFGEGRVYSTMGNPDYMAAQFTILIPVLIALILSPSGKLARFFNSLLLICMLFLLIVSQARGAWIGFLGSIAFMVVTFIVVFGKGFFSRYRLFFIGFAAFFIFLVAMFSFPNPVSRNPITERIKQGFRLTSDSASIRLFYWESALQMAKSNPLLGVGIGGFSLNTSYYQRKVLDRWEKAAPDMAAKVEPHVELYTHNDFLQTLSETGFIGFGIYLLAFGSLIVMSIRSALRSADGFTKYLYLGISAAAVAFLVNGLLNFPWRVSPTLILLWAVFAAFSVLENKKTAALGFKVPAVAGYVALAVIALMLSFQARSFYANMLIKKGQGSFAAGKYQEARDTFDAALSSNPRATDKIELVLYAGNAYNAIGDTKKAVEYYGQGLRMFPNFIESHYNVANVYNLAKMTDQAVEEYNKVLALDPKFIGALNNLANIYFNQGRFEKARDMYLKAIDAKPDSVEARYNLGATYFRLHDYKNALFQLKKTLEYDPNYELAKQWIKQLEKMNIK
jgi:putative inorganic carbon (HCO3(-)) transporter